MQRLFYPAEWLSARLSFSRKYALIGVLVLLALVALSVPLWQQLRAAIDGAQQERSGLAVLERQWQVLSQLTATRSQQLVQANAVLLRQDLAALRPALQAMQQQAQTMGETELRQRLQAVWGQLLVDDVCAEPQQCFAVLTAAINTVAAQQRATARYFRLNVDAELDTTLDMLSQRLPQLLDTVGKQQDALRIQSSEMVTFALGAQVVLAEAVPAVKAGVAQLLRSRGHLNDLLPLQQQLVQGLAQQQDSTEQATLGGVQDWAALQTVTQHNQRLVRQLFTQVLAGVDHALALRIAQQQRTQAVVVAILAGMAVALAYLFVGIYLSTQRSLRTLSDGTRDFCSGQLDTRITLRSQDELVLVADNFNTIASEFSKLLDVVREQNESRERELETQVRARTQELAEKNEQLQTVNARVQEEINLARNVQLAILPQHFPRSAHWSMHACMHPARELGGDFYDCFALPDGRYGIVVADVSGKGVGAAFFMAVSRTVLLNLALSGGAPSQVLAQANDLLCERNPMELFVTVCYGLYDPASGALVYASAGHHPPLVRQGDGTVQELPSSHDVALAIMPGMDYQDHHTTLAPGALLLLYTDGVTEAFSPSGEEYGTPRLRHWLAHADASLPAAEHIASLVRDVDGFVQGAQASDDLTCLVVCRHAPPAPAAPVEVAPAPPMAALLHCRVPASVQALAGLAEQVDAALAARPDLAYAVNLCLEELITNTVVHGLHGHSGHHVLVTVHQSAQWLEVVLQDDAPPYDPFAQAPVPDLDLDVDERPIGGLGVHLVKTLMDEVRAEHTGQGNRIVLRKALHP